MGSNLGNTIHIYHCNDLIQNRPKNLLLFGLFISNHHIFFFDKKIDRSLPNKPLGQDTDRKAEDVRSLTACNGLQGIISIGYATVMG